MTDIRLPLEPALLAQVDEARGDIPRVRWIRRLIEEHFETPAVSHPMDSPDRSARGDGGWSTKVERGPHQAGRPNTPAGQHEFKAQPGSFRCKVCGVKQGAHA